jgi:hypothetical protein
MPPHQRIDETMIRFKERLDRSPVRWARGWSFGQPGTQLQARVTYIMHEYPRHPEAQKLIGPPVPYGRFD